ncbi:MAG: 16S rRNA (uracil(1498)-N(3))-methyltransferase [Planctomycetes bacterium]|nr:16S rRNA (uracil(1498)-N(3))-methyltransferase [Planctomycetota bacterium]MBI3834458.1 16S rRNA (uracil(1498)-N(3))-methyltransferase [Planctomycetota bacterium]
MVERRFFCPDLVVGGVSLPPEEAHHAISVLRLRSGDTVILFDGNGAEAGGVVTDISRRDVRVQIDAVETREFESSIRLTLAVAMIKAHRQNYMIEKCTELGVFAIQPLATQRCVVQTAEAGVEKWRRRAIEAAKQSKRVWVPKIHAPASVAESVTAAPEFDFRAVADFHVTVNSLSIALAAAKNMKSAIIFIGPEGGWTDDERAMFEASEFQCVLLSPTVLRTETAAIAACATVAMRSVALAKCERTIPGSR